MAALIEERVWHESQKLQSLPPEGTLFEPHPGEPEALLATFRLSNLVEFKRRLPPTPGSLAPARP
jgi:hypothetical protein